jgi:GNAT superfamily N-acetyltransferase
MPEIVVAKRVGKAKRIILKGLVATTIAKTGRLKRKPLTIILQEQGAVVGGASGMVWGQNLSIDLIWIEDRFRGQGFGTRLLQTIEEEGLLHGAKQAYLQTLSIEARPFYEKHGYQVYGVITEFLAGIDRYSMIKTLAGI